MSAGACRAACRTVLRRRRPTSPRVTCATTPGPPRACRSGKSNRSRSTGGRSPPQPEEGGRGSWAAIGSCDLLTRRTDPASARNSGTSRLMPPTTFPAPLVTGVADRPSSSRPNRVGRPCRTAAGSSCGLGHHGRGAPPGVLAAGEMTNRDRRLATLTSVLALADAVDQAIAETWARLRVSLREFGLQMPVNARGSRPRDDARHPRRDHDGDYLHAPASRSSTSEGDPE